MGNSIDGFTVASVAAALSLLTENGSSTVQRDGLVLMNSAGNIIEDSGLTNTPFEFPIANLIKTCLTYYEKIYCLGKNLNPT